MCPDEDRSAYPMPARVLVSWSGGKDSAMALEKILGDQNFHVAALLTTLTDRYQRISMHGVRQELLEQQARAVGFEVEQVWIPAKSTNAVYDQRMGEILGSHHEEGVVGVVFGDIFLADLRQYREENLRRIGMAGFFPLWNENTHRLARHFIQAGYRAVVTCVDGEVLTREHVGRDYDEEFLADLPEQVDPCGENGEFHTFVYAGPIFKTSVAIERGEKVLRENRFWYCDFLLK